MILLSLQYAIFQGCLLTHIQFGKVRYDTFYYRYLVRIWPNVSRKKIWFAVRFVLPIVIIVTALVWQIYFEYEPLLGVK